MRHAPSATSAVCGTPVRLAVGPICPLDKDPPDLQGNRNAQALYDDLTTQAACMIEYPSDYHFRIRFMLALRPEVLEYIYQISRCECKKVHAHTDSSCL